MRTPIIALSGKQPHESWGGWESFLDTCERRDAVGSGDDEVVFYGKTNCNYILFPGGRLVENFGYHGKVLMGRVREEGWRVVLAEIEALHEEIREALRKFHNLGTHMQ